MKVLDVAWSRSPSSSPTKIDYGKKGTLILTSLLEHLVVVGRSKWRF